MRVKRDQVFDLFTYSDILDGDGELHGDGDDGPSLCDAVEFGDDGACDGQGLLEVFGLLQGVLACTAVDDEEGFMRCGGFFFLNDPLDFAELPHEVFFVMEPPRCVDEEDIVAFSLGDGHPLEDDGTRVGVFLFYDVDLQALGPDGELLYGTCSEGIRRDDEDFFPLLRKVVG